MKLREYQEKGVDRIIDLLNGDGAALLADEMGLGKTAQAIAVAKGLDAESVLVVCPASLRFNWQDEIEKWESTIAWEVVSYEWAAKNYTRILDKVDLLILDEAHYCKNRAAKRTKACLSYLWDKAHNRLLLTGTPCPNGLMDGWSLFNKLDPEAFPNKYKYGWRYCNAEKNWYTGNFEFKGAKKENLPELRRRISNFMVRRRKKDVLSELPPKTYQQILLDVPRAEDYRLSEQETRDALGAALSERAATRRRGVGLLKVERAIEVINNFLLAKDRLVVWTYHQDVSDKAVQALRSLDCEPLQIKGSTPMKERHEIVARFQSDDAEKLVLVAQIEAAGVGITLTAADTCIYLEQDWTPAKMAQSIDRLHRIGQESNVHVVYLIGKGTMDHQMIGVLRQKIEAITGALG